MASTEVGQERAGAGVGHKWVYLFEEGNKDMRDLLGGKGAGAAEMTNAGLPVPPGFTITTESCNAYYAEDRLPDGLWEQVQAALQKVEEQTGKRFGDREKPLLVSVRSGAKFSMPGMMDTILNLGLNDGWSRAWRRSPATSASRSTPTAASSRCSARPPGASASGPRGRRERTRTHSRMRSWR